MQKKNCIRTKQHIYESYITIHYQIILFFIKNINDYLNDGWLMKNVKRSAFKSSQTPWKLWKTVKTGVQASITVHLEEPIENSTEVFINYVIGLQVINFNILYQPLKFEHFTAIITTSSFCTCTPVLILLEAYVSTESLKWLFVNQDFGLGKNGDTRVKFR